MYQSLFSSIFIAALLTAGTALAAGQHGHAHDHQAMYGGIVAETKDLNFELVARSDSLTLFVTDHGKPVSTAGGKATATVHAGSEKTQVVLEPAGENKFVAKGSFKSGVGVRVAVAVVLQGMPENKLNFRLK